MRPAVTSMLEPSGMSCAESSVTNLLLPGSLTVTLPLTGLTTTSLWNSGVGGGSGVGAGVAVGAGVGAAVAWAVARVNARVAGVASGLPAGSVAVTLNV